MEKNVSSSRKKYNVLWIFHCYQSFLMCSSYYAWNDHIKLSFNQNRPHQFALCLSVLSNQANVLKRMFDQRYGLFFWHLSLFCFTPSLVVKGLPMWDLVERPIFVFRQFGTEFLFLVNLTFRFVVLQGAKKIIFACWS